MVGWEHNGKYQTMYGDLFNMILRDGTRSDNSFTWYGKENDRYDYFLPHKNKITKVTIYYNYSILGFRFHLSDGSTWDIGHIGGYM